MSFCYGFRRPKGGSTLRDFNVRSRQSRPTPALSAAALRWLRSVTRLRTQCAIPGRQPGESRNDHCNRLPACKPRICLPLATDPGLSFFGILAIVPKLAVGASVRPAANKGRQPSSLCLDRHIHLPDKP